MITRLFLCVLAALLAVGCSKESRGARSAERAQAFFAAGDYEKAKIEFLSLLKKDRNNADALGRIGLIWTEQGSWIQALPYLQRAHELGALSADEQLKLVYALQAGGRRAEARALASALREAEGSSGEILLFLAETAGDDAQRNEVRGWMEAYPFKEDVWYHLSVASMARRERQGMEEAAAIGRAVAADPKSVHAHLAAARLKLASADQEGAKADLRAAAAVARPRSLERLQYVEFLAQSGSLDEARAAVAEVLKEAPDFLPALIQSAQFALTAKAPDEALAALAKVFAIDSGNPGARLLQADVLIAQNQPKQAIEVLQQLDQMTGGVPMIRMKLARIQMDDGDFAGATDLLNQLVRDVTRKSEESGAPMGDAERETEVAASLLLAEINLRQGNPAAVVAAMQTLLEKYPQAEAAIPYLIRGLEGQRMFDDAIKLAQQLVEQRPAHTPYQAQLAALHAQAGQTAAARAAFERVLESSPDDETAWRRLFELDLAEGKTDDALARAQARQATHPEAVLPQFLIGLAQVARREWALAEAALLRTLELDPSHPNAHEVLSRLYVTQQRIPEAIAKIEERLVINPNDFSVLQLLAILRNEQKEFQLAADAYERLRKTLPNPSALVLNNLAVMYEQHLNKPDQALALAREARALRPSVDGTLDPEVRFEAAAIADTLGSMLYQRKQYPEAQSLLEEAAAVLSENAEFQAHYGLVAAAMGRTEAAVAALTKATSAPEEFPAKAEARQRLALLTQDPATLQSVTELQTMVEQTPDDPLLQLRLGEAWEKESKWDEAAKAYAAALARNPALAEALQKLAHLYAGPLNDPVKALDFANKARTAAPGDPAVAALLGGLAYRSGDHPFAYSLLREATSRGLKDPSTLVALARATYSVGQIDEARTTMQNALDAGAGEAHAAEARSFLTLTATPAPEAAVAEPVLAQDPKSLPARMVRAGSAVRAGQSAAAITDYTAILSDFPAFAPAQAHLAALLADDPATRARANDLAVKAREALPRDPDLAETLGRLAYHQNDFPYAINLFNEAATVRPAPARALYYLGRTHLADKDPQKGRELITQAVAAGLPQAEAAEAAAVLQGSEQ